MRDLSLNQAKREKLRQMYLETSGTRSGAADVALTGGVDHLAMISSDIGGGNMMALFDFPEHGDAPVVRGIGALHHVALKATPQQYLSLIHI